MDGIDSDTCLRAGASASAGALYHVSSLSGGQDASSSQMLEIFVLRHLASSEPDGLRLGSALGSSVEGEKAGTVWDNAGEKCVEKQ